MDQSDARGAERVNRLLPVAVGAILIVGLAPLGWDGWERHRLRGEEEERQRFIALKEREIACLDALGRNLREGMDVKAEIARCKRLAVDPETGEYQVRPRR
jgi:hypothetical protein